MINVNVKFQGGKKLPVSVKNNSTVGDVLSKAGISPENYQLKLNGKPTDLSVSVSDGKTVTLTESVKGGITVN